MPVNREWMRTYLKQFDFESLFVEELGWETEDLSVIPVGGEAAAYRAEAIAHKRGLTVYHCQPEAGGGIPDNRDRRRIEHQINQYSREHLIVYTDADQQEQVWQWVRREKGKPLAAREYRYHVSQDGESLVQRLEALYISLEDEEALTLPEVTRRTKKAFDIDKVTKRFYERFKQEHQRFLDFIVGIQARFDQEWYCSIMLNRLMFVYFMQKKGFLDGDIDYLRQRLGQCQLAHGDDEFYSFYRYFLLRLFHEGLGSPQRDDPALARLIGQIPYLNGGLFDVHELEARYPDIQIPDQAFEAIFDFFDDYQWHLDDRPLRNDREINPDVLGYIFEKYINQKQMGAYYTKEDITEYISKNTVIPFLFDAAKRDCAIAFAPDGPVWRLLKDNPNRYIYEAVQKGVDLPLPEEIAAGIEEVSQRHSWNRLAEANYALPTELWREHVARRQRCLEIREKLKNGEIHEINDLITYNLDIRQFAQDVIEQCEGPELLRAVYKAITQVSVLDPTCGSGAFLFAALNILEPLYDACLGRMHGFVEDLDRSGQKAHPEKFSDFRKILAQVAKHPNREYFILKSIILGNLYGVDIMEEAVEICKLRLFLKLVSQVDANAERPNYGLEPLPDIDFNIRAGNTLVGFATYDEVRKAVEGDEQRKLDLFSDMDRIDESAEVADRAFQMFRAQQTEQDMDAAQFKDAKEEVKRRLKELNDELNRYLAREYGVNANKVAAFDKWLKSHQPFHWFVEFYRIIRDGGFNVIVGNPPWKEYSSVKKSYKVKNYRVEKSGNLYALCTERILTLSPQNGCISFIVQLPLVSSSRMAQLRQMLEESSNDLFVVPFDDRPGKLFNGLQHCRSSIFISNFNKPKGKHRLFTAKYQRWLTEVRPHLFSQIEYAEVLSERIYLDEFPKYSGSIEERIFGKVMSKSDKTIASVAVASNSNSFVFYQEATQYWIKAIVGLPFYSKNGDTGAPAHGRYLYFKSETDALVTCSLLNSSIFYAYFVAYGDCFHLSHTLATKFPINSQLFQDDKLAKLSQKLMINLRENAERKTIETKAGDTISYDEYFAAKAKPIIDKIDSAIAQCYGLNVQEVDFIANYDIKYRMGLYN